MCSWEGSGKQIWPVGCHYLPRSKYSNLYIILVLIMNKLKEFIAKLEWPKWVTEISNLHKNLGKFEQLDEILEKEDSLYFVSFIPSYKRIFINNNNHQNPPRTKEDYIAWKRYIQADFDIRSYIFKHEWRVISNEELMEYLPKLEAGLKSDESLASYNAIVFSWNGFHFYWIWETVYIDGETYSRAVTAIYDRIKSIFKDTPELRPDYATSNIARLMRLPGTWNKKEKYGLPPAKVEILKFEDTISPLVGKLHDIWKRAKQKESKRIESDLKKIKEYTPSRKESDYWPFGNWRWWYNEINENVKISTLVSKYTWRKLADNGKNFISNLDGWYTGAYVIPEENVVVHMWTPHFSDYYRVYSPFAFILVHYADWDVRRTFAIARELFPKLSLIREEQLSYLPSTHILYGIN